MLQTLAEQMMQHCDVAMEKLYKNESLFTIRSMDYILLDIHKTDGYNSYSVSMEWHVEADEYSTPEADRDYWMTKVKTTDPQLLFVDDEMYYIFTNISLIYNNARVIEPGAAENTDIGYSEIRCSYCGKSFRASSSYGRRVQKGMHCGFQGCGK